MKTWLGCILCVLALTGPISAGIPTSGIGAQAKPDDRVRVQTLGQPGIRGVQDVEATPSPSTPATPAAQAVRERPPLSLTLMLLFTCCSVGLVLGMLVVGIMASRGNQGQGKDEKGVDK